MAKIDTANIKKVKGALEDLLVGIGKESQERVTGTKQVTKINVSDLNGVLSFTTINELRAVDVSLLGPSKLVIVAGDTNAIDKLGGIFVWDDSSIATDDGKFVIKTTTNNIGRFVRVDNKYESAMDINSLSSNTINNSGNIVTDTLDANDITVNTNISAQNTNFTNLKVTGMAITAGQFNHGGDLNVTGEITGNNINAENIITKNASVDNFIKDAIFDGNVKINGKLEVSSTEGGGITIPQDLEVNSLKVKNEIQCKTLNGIVFTKDEDTGNYIVSIDSVGINQDLIVNGKSTLNNNLTINGAVAASGNILSNGKITANQLEVGNTHIAGTTTLDAAVTAKADITVDGNIFGKDNISMLGDAAHRFKQVWSTNGTIQTSDDRTKTYLSIDDKEYNAAKEMFRALRKFKRIGGDRIHFGVSAQTVRDILASNGLNPLDYSFLCLDEWEEFNEETKEVIKVDRYSIRYEELYAFMMITLFDKE